jgi:PelA/Pel-15E family pectate lyase
LTIDFGMRPDTRLRTLLCVILLGLWSCSASAQPSVEDSVAALHRAVDFFRQHASAGGGYVYRLSNDLTKREGEGKAGPTTAWVQPPGTPRVGMAYLTAFQLTGEPVLLEAAGETADALIRGQLRSGGWAKKIEFSEAKRAKYAYRTDGIESQGSRNTTTFDDNVSQSAISFLMRLDQELNFEDEAIHEAVIYALEAVLKAQYANGAWPQRYDGSPQAGAAKIQQASFPANWAREHPDVDYSRHYTLNDKSMSDLILLCLDAWDIYGDPRYLLAAEKGGEFLLRAQLPEPQPGWAQQYDLDMHPTWARRFEPPAITGSESQEVMRTLIKLYRRTAAVSKNADRFLEPLPRAISYFRRSELEDGQLARFYEMGTNRPLFFTRDYQLTYSSDDLPRHYAFTVQSELDQIETELERVLHTPKDELWNRPKNGPFEPTRTLARRAQRAIDSLDDRGAWVKTGRLKHHGSDDPTRAVIPTKLFVKNLTALARWIAANQ